MSTEQPFDPREFASQIVPPENPYAGYEARQQELSEKDHPHADRAVTIDLGATALSAESLTAQAPKRVDKRPLSPRKGMDRDEARTEDQAAHTANNRLAVPREMTEAEKAAQPGVNERGAASVRAANPNLFKPRWQKER